jgi:alkylation response protein AidB-like acyl-CoA dehydrogenase
MDQTATDARVLGQVKGLSEEFEIRAEETDTSGPGNSFLLRNIRALASIGFFGAKVNLSDGGLGLSPKTFAECQEIIASACGVTAFMQQQLHSGATHVAKSVNNEFKATHLPQIVSGAKFCGIAFSHLRRSGPPLVVVEKLANGYLVNGIAPWVTGWRFLDSFALGARTPEGKVVFCYIPIAESINNIIVSAPLRVTAMNAGDTVEVKFNNLIIPTRYMLFEQGEDYMERVDYSNIAGPVQMPLGCVRGCAKQLRLLSTSKNKPLFAKIAQHFEDEATVVREFASTWNSSRASEPDYKANALKARSDAIRLAMRSTQACIAACSGSAHLLTNPAQRRHREASFYATVAQTSDTQGAFLETLAYER